MTEGQYKHRTKKKDSSIVKEVCTNRFIKSESHIKVLLPQAQILKIVVFNF